MKPAVTQYMLNDLWQALVAKNGECWARVMSDSMYPVIAKHDRVLVEAVSGVQVRFGDIIVFRRNRMLVIHRVIGKKNSEGEHLMLEKGDANLEFGLVSPEQIVGRVTAVRREGRMLSTVTPLGRILQGILTCISYSSTRLQLLWKRFPRKESSVGLAAQKRMLTLTERIVLWLWGWIATRTVEVKSP